MVARIETLKDRLRRLHSKLEELKKSGAAVPFPVRPPTVLAAPLHPRRYPATRGSGPLFSERWA